MKSWSISDIKISASAYILDLREDWNVSPMFNMEDSTLYPRLLTSPLARIRGPAQSSPQNAHKMMDFIFLKKLEGQA